MKKQFVLAAIFSLLVFAVAVSAQKATDFSGTWNLAVAKSKLGDRNTIESQTMTVTQTATDLKVETATKRLPPPADAPAGGPPGGGRMGGGMMGGGDAPVTYILDGKEVKSEMQGGQGKMQVSTKAKIDGGKLEITRSITTPMGDRTTTEKWWLNADGTLTTESSRPNRDGGTDTTTKVFAKKS
ncbi:MAG: hypothetical protein ABIO36_00375 [Pyrinomonadaceae bacterium]